jgi:hypothetical protein
VSPNATTKNVCLAAGTVGLDGLRGAQYTVHGRVHGWGRIPTASKGRELATHSLRAPTSRTFAMPRRSGLARVPTVPTCIATSEARAWGISIDACSVSIVDETRRRGKGSTNNREILLHRVMIIDVRPCFIIVSACFQNFVLGCILTFSEPFVPIPIGQ